MRPTGAGLAFLALVACGVLVAINYSSNLVFAISFLLCGLIGAAFWQGRDVLAGLDGTVRLGRPAFAGGEVEYRVQVGAGRRGRIPAAPFQAEIAGAPPAQVGGTDGAGALLRRPAERRGPLPEAPVRLTTTYPLGLFRASLSIGEAPATLVYPCPARRGGRPPVTGLDAARHSDADAFTALRPYVPGDRVSHIAWKAMARTGEVMVKSFDGSEGLPELWLDWQDAAAEPEQRLSLLTRWLLDASHEQRRYGLRLPGLVVPVGSGPAHDRRCLEALATFGLGDGA